MEQNAFQLRFYEELNDYLPPEKRKVWFTYHFSGNPVIKDIIESIGVPPAEVDLILINGKSVDFSYQVKNNDRVSVYPVFESFDISSVSRLRSEPLREPKFILDTHLGKLVQYLRLLGFDTLYRNDYSFSRIIEIAERDKRIILTRKKTALTRKNITRAYQVKTVDPEKQIQEVIGKFDLFSEINPFSICLKCNGNITAIEKNKVVDRLPSLISKHFTNFYICSKCKRIYWQGLHYHTLLSLVRLIKK